MPSTWEVEGTFPEMYLDEGRNPIRGYLVRVRFHTWNALIDFTLPDIKPETVKAKAEAWIADRDALDALGKG